ncbi:MAG: glycoside hydrolase family 5 protein [Erysipelotrichaceae bacterium]|nr:glycoside hydrolase family 5 protein [Erysipelotrichaceae bacterium]
MYVLVDWHDMVDEDPNESLDQAADFFLAVIERFGSCPNMIYECCNEPGGDWPIIKDYCEKIIPLIREKDPDASAVVVSGFRYLETFLAQYRFPYRQKRKVKDNVLNEPFFIELNVPALCFPVFLMNGSDICRSGLAGSQDVYICSSSMQSVIWIVKS